MTMTKEDAFQTIDELYDTLDGKVMTADEVSRIVSSERFVQAARVLWDTQHELVFIALGWNSEGNEATVTVSVHRP